MPPSRRWLVIAVVVIVVSLAAAAVLRTVLLNDSTRAVSLDEALDQYRSTTTLAIPPPSAADSSSVPVPVTVPATVPATTPETMPPVDPPSVPATGVYRYRTTGSESIDALGGTAHTYPAETTITVTIDGCGVLLRWDALVERREEWRLCATAAGIELQPVAEQYHEFYGRTENERMTCDRAVLLVPATADSRPTARPSCALGDDVWLPVFEVLERSERAVEDVTVEVTHVRQTVTDDDEYDEHSTIDWFLDQHGLPVVVTSTKASRSPSVVGTVLYREEFTLELVSTAPLR